ncbi:MAG TPA: hypothetical protein VFW81_05525, partial [Thermoanaerobaculia bacterium]|nr:hypothetical protein [Thermoanaerobaculia bacterium]
VSGDGVAFPPFVTDPLSPDGRWFIGASSPGKFARYPVGGGEPHSINGIEGGELPIRWSSDGRTIFTRRRVAPEPAKIWRLDPDNGRRAFVKEIRSAESGGLPAGLVMTADGRAYAYLLQRGHSQLYLAEGLK